MKTPSGRRQFFAPKKTRRQNVATFCWAMFPFCQALVFNHWGLLGSRVGYVRLTWEACFDVRAKTRAVQICQVRRQVHLADVFDGGLFVIKLGRTNMLQTWNSSCNSPGARKMTRNLVPEVKFF